MVRKSLLFTLMTTDEEIARALPLSRPAYEQDRRRGGLHRKLRLLSNTHTRINAHKHTHTHISTGWMLSWSGMYEKSDTHRLTCPLDKEVHVSSFLLQPYPVTNSLLWGMHTYAHTHTQPCSTGTSTSTVGLCSSPFSLSFTCVSPLGSYFDLFTPAVCM